MRWAWLAILCAAAGTGCISRLSWPFVRATPAANAPATTRSLSPTLPVADGSLYVESVLLERPAGDELLDRELWVAGLANLPPQTAALVQENGLRVAVLSGALPPAFQKLLDSEPDTVNPHGLTFGVRKDAVIPTAEPPDPCEFSVLTDLAGTRSSVKLSQARAGLLVRPESLSDGRVKVWCEPQLQHGLKKETLKATADGTGFTMQVEVPVASYPSLGFEVSLGPNDYLIVGWPASTNNNLGMAMFAVEANNLPRQRVLVVRAGKMGDATPTDLPSIRGSRTRLSIAAEVSRR